MHRRRRQHNGTRNALCCHRRRSDNLHDFSVSAQQPASRIIHSSFDLDGRHSTASHSFGLHLDVSRPEAFPSSPSVARALFIFREECSWDIISFVICLSLSLSLAERTKYYISNIHLRAARTILFYRAAHRSTSLHSSISRAAHPINFLV